MNTALRTIHLPLAATLVALTTISAHAQDVAPAVAPEKSLTLWQLFTIGGWTMWILLVCSIAMIGLIIYNAIALRRAKFLRPDLFQTLRESMINMDLETARQTCEANPTALTNIVNAGIDRITGGHIDLESIERGMEEAATEEVASNLFPINCLSIIAVISPMIGLLGTVSGMIKAFQAMSVGGMGRPELLADNISEALVTTASGLIVGIPAMIAYFFFKNRFTGLLSQMNRMCGELLQRLKQATQRYQVEVEAGHFVTHETAPLDQPSEL
jgi:biopolymer transport protein ExbB